MAPARLADLLRRRRLRPSSFSCRPFSCRPFSSLPSSSSPSSLLVGWLADTALHVQLVGTAKREIFHGEASSFDRVRGASTASGPAAASISVVQRNAHAVTLAHADLREHSPQPLRP